MSKIEAMIYTVAACAGILVGELILHLVSQAVLNGVWPGA